MKIIIPDKEAVFLGMAKLLSNCSSQVSEDLRDAIENALFDVCTINPRFKTWRCEGKVFLEPVE